MIPVGYMAKRTCAKPKGFDFPGIEDVYSVSGDVNDDFADYINAWKHNGYWLFDSPRLIRDVAKELTLSLDGTTLFFYEAYEQEFNEKEMTWSEFAPEPSLRTNVELPVSRRLEGFDLVTFYARNAPECSPLSCNGLAAEIPTNSHCLIDTFEEAKSALESGKCSNAEPGPYRIFSVYSVDWPDL